GLRFWAGVRTAMPGPPRTAIASACGCAGSPVQTLPDRRTRSAGSGAAVDVAEVIASRRMAAATVMRSCRRGDSVLFRERGPRRREARDGDAVGRARNVVEARAVEELD